MAESDSIREPLEGEKIVTLDVERMTWGGCRSAVRMSIAALEGVNEVVVDLAKRNAIIIYNPNKVDTAAMMAATTKVGFPSKVHTKTVE